MAHERERGGTNVCPRFSVLGTGFRRVVASDAIVYIHSSLDPPSCPDARRERKEDGLLNSGVIPMHNAVLLSPVCCWTNAR